MPRDGALPFETPRRRAGRRRVKLDWAGAGHDRADILSADEGGVHIRMIEIVAAEIVDHRAGGTRGHEGVDVDALVHEDGRAANGLITVVASDHPLAGPGVVGLADAREQQGANVVQWEGGDEHDFGRLLEFAPRAVDIGDAGRFFAGTVEIDAQYLAAGPELIIRVLEQEGQNDCLRAGLGVVLASVALAEPAKDALLELQTERIGVRAAEI